MLEPNLCAVNTAQLPMPMADVAHRRDPSCVDHLHVYNTMVLMVRNSTDFARALTQLGVASRRSMRYPDSRGCGARN
ncbi:DUF2827 family protein [Burkholderia ubonensis]|uniref:DUF2827 family protein n=1 Tax=Burkholderia ubonensis TaxID=101571 RepID=UPI0039F572D6